VERSPSDVSLAQDVRRVVNMPDEAILGAVGVWVKQDRKELKRILGHLPVIDAGRTERHRYHPQASEPPQRSSTPMAPRGGGAGTPMSARHAPPRASSAMGSARAMSARGPRAPAARTGGAPSAGAREDTSCSTPSAARGPAATAWPSGGSDTSSAAEARHWDRLAAMGIDPTGMTATDIVRLFYARGSNTTMKAMNQEAEKRLNVRPQTPRAFKGVLTQRAHKEVRVARDLPASDLHHHLDKWEVESLADMCRSLKHHDVASKGACSEYTGSYTKQYKTNLPPRKKFVRKPV